MASDEKISLISKSLEEFKLTAEQTQGLVKDGTAKVAVTTAAELSVSE